MIFSHNLRLKIYNLLLDHPETRDCDFRLQEMIWKEELEKQENRNSFFDALHNKELTSSESICRLRRKLQEKHPHLRGDKWEGRHDMAKAYACQLTFFDL